MFNKIELYDFDLKLLEEIFHNKLFREYFFQNFGIGKSRYIAAVPTKDIFRKNLKKIIDNIVNDNVVNDSIKKDFEMVYESIINNSINGCDINDTIKLTYDDYNSNILFKLFKSQNKTFISLRSCYYYANILHNFFKYCNSVYFVDPYIDFQEPRYKNIFYKYIELINENKKCPSISIYCKQIFDKRENKLKITNEVYEKVIRKFFENIKNKVSIRIYNKNFKMHNRYIITDKTGIIFPHGLDIDEFIDKNKINEQINYMEKIDPDILKRNIVNYDSKNQENIHDNYFEDIAIMDYDHWKIRWNLIKSNYFHEMYSYNFKINL